MPGLARWPSLARSSAWRGVVLWIPHAIDSLVALAQEKLDLLGPASRPQQLCVGKNRRRRGRTERDEMGRKSKIGRRTRGVLKKKNMPRRHAT